jgi:hypothetical protein
MLEPLKLNPNYTGWGPGDDGMKGPGEWWDNACVVDGWDANQLTVDELNEIVNFYFKINRPAKNCEACNGNGSTYTGPATLDLVLWVLHPRKGASRGWTIKNIQHEELPEVYAFLRTAAASNAKRFATIPAVETMLERINSKLDVLRNQGEALSSLRLDELERKISPSIAQWRKPRESTPRPMPRAGLDEITTIVLPRGNQGEPGEGGEG